MRFRWLVAIAAIGVGAATQSAQATSCPTDRKIVEFSGLGDQAERIRQRQCLVTTLGTPNTIVYLGPDVDFDFSSMNDFPIHLARCVTVKGVATLTGSIPCPETLLYGGVVIPLNGSGPVVSREDSHAAPPADLPGSTEPTPARTARSLGPILHYGRHDARTSNAFLEARCSGGIDGEGARISGFRLFGPTLEDQTSSEKGINVTDCQDVEISNMEIAGWGEAAISIDNKITSPDIPDHEPRDVLVLVHDNFIHHNQHSNQDGHATGYGVEVGLGGWAKIYQNIFDFNRHSVTSGGNAGGYFAERNLVLKGGGYHNGTFLGISYEKYIHVFDAHGNDNCGIAGHPDTAWNCGDAGRTFLISENTFQYKKTTDIKFRGQPKNLATISRNIFARSDKDAAIDLYRDCCTVKVWGNNQYDVDTFGQYAVGDFDGDGVDDLFLATGVTWWLSSAGQFPWSFLRRDDAAPKNLRFGYFDDDLKCDVLMETLTGEWSISSGGTSEWKYLGDFGHPLSEVRFGRFDEHVRDHRPGVTRKTTHAFWRRSDGQWFVTALSGPNWQPVQSSSFPLSQLQFGDFTGDGVTDVLAVVNGHWAISESATGQWRTLNPSLGEPVGDLTIANMDADDNIDDILKLERKYEQVPQLFSPALMRVTLTWWRSKNGTDPWVKWQSYTTPDYFVNDEEFIRVFFGFAGRFGAVPGNGTRVVNSNRVGGGTMLTDERRGGRFFNPAEIRNGRPANWVNNVLAGERRFAY